METFFTFRILLKYNPIAKYINVGMTPKRGDTKSVLSGEIIVNPSEMRGLRVSFIECIKTTNKSERERKKISVYIIVQTAMTTKLTKTNNSLL